MEILDSVSWAHDRLLPWLEVHRRVESATVHPTCATRHMGLAGRLRSLAGVIPTSSFVPSVSIQAVVRRDRCRRRGSLST